jgi:hypothetical protein
MRQSEIFLLLLLLVGLGGCATRNPEGAPLVPQAAVPTPPRTVPQSFFAEEGIASWCGRRECNSLYRPMAHKAIGTPTLGILRHGQESEKVQGKNNRKAHDEEN